MSLTREEEEYWTLRVVHNLTQTIKVGEEQMCTLVCSETTAEANHQSIRVDTLKQRNHTCRITLVAQPCLCELLTDILDELLLQSHTSLPYLSVGHIIDSMPDLLVRLVKHEVLIEILIVEVAPLCCSP